MPDARKGEHVMINLPKHLRGKKGVSLTEQLVLAGGGSKELDHKNRCTVHREFTVFLL
jgi:hypothetical protein